MTQSLRGSVGEGEEREDGQGSHRREPSTCSRLDDSADRRKSQAQRLLEFEMWTNHSTLKDLEYSQRRSEKKQRQRERRKYYQKRCWKKVYLPAVLSMVTGTFLTLCATLQTLAGDTFLWNARSVFMYLGPVLIGVGFLALMLAAGCTFKHDKEARQKSLAPPKEFVSKGFVYHYRRPSSALRSDSVLTADLPLPEDLDPSRSYVQSKGSRWGSRSGGRMRSVSWDDSVHDIGPLTLENSYSSTATWVQLVSAAHSHSKPIPLTRQISDTHLTSSPPSPHFQHLQEVPLRDTDQGHLGSQSDLHVTCTRSVTSSGYHSASDSTSGTVEYQTSCDSSLQRNSTYTPLRYSARHSTNHSPTKNPVRDSKLTGNRTVRGSLDTAAEHLYPVIVKKPQQPSIPQNTSPTHKNPVSVTFSKPQAFHQGINISDRNPQNSEAYFTQSNIPTTVSSKTMARLISADLYTRGKAETPSVKYNNHALVGSVKQADPDPRLLYPICSVRTTDL